MMHENLESAEGISVVSSHTLIVKAFAN
jgi:hypothetical protein